jgi:flagellar basal body-associated protein FliL
MDKSKQMMIIIIALLVLLLGTVVGVAVYVVSIVNSPSIGADAVVPDRESITRDEVTSVPLGSEPIVTNIPSTTGTRSRFIRVNGWVGYDNTQAKLSDEFGELLNDNIHFARSIMLACVKASTYEELNTPDGLMNLESKILTRLQQEFESSLIVEVRIDDFVLQ